MYKFKAPTRATNIRGDQEEKIVFKIIENAGNLGDSIHIVSCSLLTSLLKYFEIRAFPHLIRFFSLLIYKNGRKNVKWNRGDDD